MNQERRKIAVEILDDFLESNGGEQSYAELLRQLDSRIQEWTKEDEIAKNNRAEVFRKAYFGSLAASKEFYSKTFAMKFQVGSMVNVADLRKESEDVGYEILVNELRRAVESGLITESAFREVTGREL